MRGVDQLLEQPRFRRLWEKASRRAHTLFLDVIDDRRKHLRIAGGKVVLDLHPLVEQLAQREGLSGSVTRAIPPDAGRLVIMRRSRLETAQSAVRVVRALSYVLSVLALALYALAVYVAGRGRRSATVLGIGLAVLAVGILVLVARRLVGDWVVRSLTGNPDFETASAHAWAIGSSLLRDAAVSLIAYGGAIAGAGWIAGPARTAIAVRRTIAPTLREHPAVIYVFLAFALLIFLAIGPVDGNRLVPLLALFGFACLGGEALRRQTARESRHAAMARRRLQLFSQSDRSKKALAPGTKPRESIA